MGARAAVAAGAGPTAGQGWAAGGVPQSLVELAQMWDGGLLASVAGLRFDVPVKSIDTGLPAQVLPPQTGRDLARRRQ